MNAIRFKNKEYGYKHDWANMGTEQMPFPEDRSTLFICKKCKIYFRHYYHCISDIYDAMKQANINEECLSDNKS